MIKTSYPAGTTVVICDDCHKECELSLRSGTDDFSEAFSLGAAKRCGWTVLNRPYLNGTVLRVALCPSCSAK